MKTCVDIQIKRRLFLVVLSLLIFPVFLLSKPRLAVVEFSVKVPKAHNQLGTAMSDMLTHSLVQTGKYTVLERSAIEKIRQEQKLAITGEVDASTGAQFGKLIGAKYIIVGTVSRFEEKTKGGGIGGILGKKLAGGAVYYESELAIIVRIIDSTTGEIILSENIDKKKGSVGIAAITSMLGVPIAGGLFKSASMQKAIEEAIEEAVKMIGDKIPAEDNGSGLQNNEITLQVSGVTFSSLKKMTDMMGKISGVENLQKSFSDNLATIIVQYTGNAEELADALYNAKSSDLNFEITGLEQNRIELKIVE